MTIQTAQNACEAAGWPGAFGFASFCLMIVGLVWACMFISYKYGRK